MPRTANPVLPPGSMLAHYRIEEPIGEGAMGTVYRAHDEGLDRKVAVKVLRPGASGMTVRVDRFFREARAAARVNHPNLTHVHFVGGDGSYRFFAMEYVTGESLDDHVRLHGPPDLDTGLDILIQAAAGLSAAHEAQIVHRDVKPSNIMVRPNGTVKITDFGLSKSIEADVAQSHDGAVTGTPTYMSPEQCRSGKVDVRTDIYALGLTAWAMFVGAPPYPGPHLGDVINDQINRPLPSLTAKRPDLSRAVEQVIEKMCAKDPDDRPADMLAVVELLEACRPRAVHPAPIVARAVAVGLDLAAALVAMMSISFLVQRLRATGGTDAVSISITGAFEETLYAVLFMSMTVVAELRHTMTLGKWFLNICVRRADGSEAPRRAFLLRALIRFPSIAFWAVGLGLIFGSLELPLDVIGFAAIGAGIVTFYVTKGRTLSDVLTGTRVVYLMPPDERRRAGG